MLTMRLLYVDDDRINTLLFEETCRFVGGLEVASAGSGAEALEIVREFAPDVLVVDLHLPDTTGYALLAALRGAAGRPEMPAFLCTADDEDAVLRAGSDAGFLGCWRKPVDRRSMLADLSRLGHRPGASA
jgi:two-component system OmpR family response regulator